MELQLNCPNCDVIKPYYGTSCLVCSEYIGYPNVRAAAMEKDELEQRYESAYSSIAARGIDAEAKAFEAVINNNSSIVTAKSLKKVINMLNDDNLLFVSFMQEVSSGARIAEHNQYDISRESYEAKIHPYDHQNIQYAALSLTETGADYYGNCHMKFKTAFFSNRSTLFEENIVLFIEKHNICGTNPIPKGYRSTWADRSKLAIVKLHAKIQANQTSTDFQNMISSTNKEEPDFIEIHIFGTIHAKSIEKITIIGNINPQDNVMLNAYTDMIKDQGIKLERLN